MADEATTEVTEVATTTVTETETPAEGQPAELGDAGKKALDTLRAEKKAAEKEAKEAKAQLADLQRAAMSDQERAIDEAKTATRAEVLGQVGSKIAAAEFKAAAAGRLDDDQLTTLLAGLDLAAFLTPEGDVDSAKVGSFIDGIAPAAPDGRPADLGQGARATGPSLNSDPLLQSLKDAVGAR